MTDESRRQQRSHRGCYGRQTACEARGRQPTGPTGEREVRRLPDARVRSSMLKAPAVSGLHQQLQTRIRWLPGCGPEISWPRPRTRSGCPFSHTCRPTASGWLYVALILILFIHKFVGRAMSAPMPTAQRAGLAQSASGTNPIRHWLAVGGHRKLLAACGILVSISRRGDCWECADGRGQRQREGRVRAGAKCRAIAAQAPVKYFGY